jgi:hypothetical protein
MKGRVIGCTAKQSMFDSRQKQETVACRAVATRRLRDRRDITDPFLGNGLVNMLRLLDRRFLIMQQCTTTMEGLCKI